jgi:hypothetical protein
VKRRPRIVGLPPQTAGSLWIRLSAMQVPYLIPPRAARSWGSQCNPKRR